jgi:glycosyltransferase involved in cell wall biosynthesis
VQHATDRVAGPQTRGHHATVARSPRVSVIIPTVRGGPLLAKAVRSVLAQTVAELEVLVVKNADDVDISELPDDARVKVLHEGRAGRAFAVNRGALAAKGRWLALLDDDDTWLERKLERQFQALEGWSGVAASATNYHRVDEEGGVVKLGIARKGSRLDLISFRTAYLPSTFLVSREVFFLVGAFDPSYRFCDDFDFLLRISSLGDIAFVREPMVRYLVHARTMSQESRTLTWLEAARVVSDARRAAAIRRDWRTWWSSWRATIVHRRMCTSDELGLALAGLGRERPSVTAHRVANALRASPPDVVRLLVKWILTGARRRLTTGRTQKLAGEGVGPSSGAPRGVA